VVQSAEHRRGFCSNCAGTDATANTAVRSLLGAASAATTGGSSAAAAAGRSSAVASAASAAGSAAAVRTHFLYRQCHPYCTQCPVRSRRPAWAAQAEHRRALVSLEHVNPGRHMPPKRCFAVPRGQLPWHLQTGAHAIVPWSFVALLLRCGVQAPCIIA